MYRDKHLPGLQKKVISCNVSKQDYRYVVKRLTDSIL